MIAQSKIYVKTVVLMNGKAHFAANCFILFGTFGIVTTQRPELLIPAMTGSTLGTLITPDYDLKSIYIKSVINNIPIFGALWNAYWWPYAVMFKHRKISHNLIFGTLTRFLYLLTPIIIIYILYIQDNYNIDIYNIYIILFFWYVQDFSHYILDLKIFSSKDD